MSRIPTEYRAPTVVIGSYCRELAEMRPDNLDVVHLGNDAIDDVRDSQLAAEDRGDLPRMQYRSNWAFSDLAEVEGSIKGMPCPFRM